jgi:hypothetical protein
MLPENDTTASEQTTETTSTETVTPETASTDTSTTETNQSQTTNEDEGTLLTPKEGETETAETEQTAEEKAAAEAQAALYGAPEGDYTLPELPDGQTVDAEALAAVTPIAKELNLSDAGFAKIVDVYASKVLPGVQDRVVDNLQKDIAAQHAAWASQSMEMLQTDPMFAGLKLADVQQVAAKALDRFGGSEIREFLQTTGLGNNPAFLKSFYQIGTAISEDASFERGGPGEQKLTSTEKFYGRKSPAKS